jgi:hypothetical protein
MYKVTLSTYATPIRGPGFVGKEGNLSAAVSVVRAIYHALNARTRDFEVVVEGLSSGGLEDVLFSVKGDVIDRSGANGLPPIFDFEYRANLTPKVDLPTLAYILDEEVEDGVTRQLFNMGEDAVLSAPNLRIGAVPSKNSWMIRLHSNSVKYDIRIATDPQFFDRLVSVDVEVDPEEIDEEDRRAILEVATVLADRDFREDGRYQKYLAVKGRKPLTRFEVYELTGLDIEGSDLSMGLHGILANEHYSHEDFLALVEDNFVELVPRYLVLKDKLRGRVTRRERELSLSLARHRFQVGQLAEDAPDADKVLEVGPVTYDDILTETEVYLASLQGVVRHEVGNSHVHRQIRTQLLQHESAMRDAVHTARQFQEIIGKIERAGLVSSQGFESVRFFAHVAHSGINELAIEALTLLEADN